METKKIPLKVSKFTTKSGREIPVLKFGDKVVTFDEVIILSMTNMSPRDLASINEDVILAEF